MVSFAGVCASPIGVLLKLNANFWGLIMKRSSWIILGLVVVLGLIYFLTREDHVSVGVKRLKLPTFEPDKFDRIEIKSKDNVNLVKQDGQFVLELKDKDKSRVVHADQANVTGMLDAVLALRHSHYVTNLKEKLPEFGLLGGEEVFITLSSNGTKIWDLVLGKNAAGSGRYAKLPDSDDIYVVKGSFWQLTRNGLADWRDRDLFPVKEGEINSLKMFKGNDVYLTLMKGKDTEDWMLDAAQKNVPKGFRVDKVALLNLVRSAVNLKASNFVDETKALKDPVAEKLWCKAVTKNYVLLFFAKANDGYLAKRSDDDQI